MAFRRILSKIAPAASNSTGKVHFHRDSRKPAADPSPAATFFRRFLQRRAINHHSAPNLLPSLTLSVGEKLREKLRSLNVPGGDRLRVDGLIPLPPAPESSPVGFSVTIADAKRVLRFMQLEKIRAKLRDIPSTTISYSNFVAICVDACGHRDEDGRECAKALDECGSIIVLGGVVFLRPDLVARSMEKLILTTTAMPDDLRRKELDRLEKEKAEIDEKAHAGVRAEMYYGLGFLLVQTLGLMRLTFWELSWDVMEPICFFLTSIHFALAYAFFLRTSKEPTLQGFFQRRFKSKQKKLMKIHGFDAQRYNQLCQAFYSSPDLIQIHEDHAQAMLHDVARAHN